MTLWGGRSDGCQQQKEYHKCFGLVSFLRWIGWKPVSRGRDWERRGTPYHESWLRMEGTSFLLLGLPFGGIPPSTGFWRPVLDGIRKKLATRQDYLLLGGRNILIRVKKTNLLVYYLSLFKIPVKVGAAVEEMQRNFLWHKGEWLKVAAFD